jgi:broad specificity phosphatase PhoE
MLQSTIRSLNIQLPLKNKYALLRHGQTDANDQKIYMGRLDYELNDVGIQQAQGVTLPFAPDVVLHSPLKRTLQTAQIVAGGYDLISESRLIEKAGGDIEGMRYDDIAEKYPDVWGTWQDKPLEEIVNATFPGGESDFEVSLRFEELILELESRYTNKSILLVTHSGVMQAARYTFGGSKESIYFDPISNCGIDIL